MKSPAYELASGTFAPMLRSLSALLDKAAADAARRGYDPRVLVDARLAPDMYPLSRQVQFACDLAKDGLAQLTGKPPPKFDDDERTLEALQARIARTIEQLETVRESDLAGAEERDIRLPMPRGGLVLEMKGFPFLRDWVVANFYFHVVTAYDILRHNGVEIGKPDFLAHVAGSLRPA